MSQKELMQKLQLQIESNNKLSLTICESFNNFKGFQRDFKDFKNIVTALMDKIGTLESTVQKQQAQIEALVQQQSRSESNVPNGCRQVANFLPPIVTMAKRAHEQTQANDEAGQRESKIFNCVVIGLPDSDNCVHARSDEKLRTSNKNLDLDLVRKVLDKLGVDPHMARACFRMGVMKTATGEKRNRLLKVIGTAGDVKAALMSPEGRAELSMVYKIHFKNSQKYTIGVRHDLTATQRDLQRAAFQVCSAVAAEAPESGTLKVRFENSRANPGIYSRIERAGRVQYAFYGDPFSEKLCQKFNIDLEKIFSNK